MKIEISNSNISRLTEGKVLALNTILNIIGQVIPLMVAIIAIPIIIKGLGRDRFGVLTLVWTFIGYFSLFDLGLGRSLTKLAAEKLGNGEGENIPALVATCLFLMLILGLLAAFTVLLVSPWLVNYVLKIPEGLKNETLWAFSMLAISTPFVITTAGFIGLLEAQQRFGSLNLVRTIMGVLIYLSPLFVLRISQSLFHVVAVLTVLRFFAWVVYLMLCVYTIPQLYRRINIRRSLMGPLLSFGGWITVSNIVSPLMTYLDRFLIGALLSMNAVAYYVTPYEVITKLWIVPSAIVAVLFPAFSTSFGRDPKRTALIFNGGLKCTFLLLFPICLVALAAAKKGLEFWLGEEFVLHSTHVLQWLVIGVFVNSLGRMPFALIQGLGRPDLTAKVNFIELPFYLIFLWGMINVYGIEGAAIAWTVRLLVDMAVLLFLSRSFLPKNASLIRPIIFHVGLAFAAFCLFALLPNMILLMGMLPPVTLAVWFMILSSEERVAIQNTIKKILSFESATGAK